MESSRSRTPALWAVVAGCAAAIALLIPWGYVVAVLYVEAGGSFGFFGDGSSPDAWWYWPAAVAVTLVALSLVYAAGSRAYGIAARRHSNLRP